MAASSMAAKNGSYVVPVQSSDKTRKRFIALYRCASKGNWDVAETIPRKSPQEVRARISKEGDTVLHVLHVAPRASHAYFVKQLVEKMELKTDDLRKKNEEQNTVYCLAVMSGNTDIVKFMMSKDRKLAKIKGKNDMLPLQIGALFGHEKIGDDLYKATYYLEDQNRIDLLVTLIDNHLYAK